MLHGTYQCHCTGLIKSTSIVIFIWSSSEDIEMHENRAGTTLWRIICSIANDYQARQEQFQSGHAHSPVSAITPLPAPRRRIYTP